ncbi:Rne/Rng family ribonuclease [Methylobrevis albus]|uniref:Ribonuclease E n=1 Tax=Methylobrevis albus TaxID=2793297 RepID=A0A931I5J3_9HYPH|nr:ribonuclease E/G [Methylobrevis albus]MBH0239226.1 Rne/Rng family ribonuclease [Methylobrevis albus]
MPNKMLIDSTHPEETRVVVVRGSRVEEFDFESANRKQLRGNIYLAKVTRVEPSLQAAFVEYGGNRHGFLAFSEIHPDYYQIPVADRQALIDAEADEPHEDFERPSPRRKARERTEKADSPSVSEAATTEGDGEDRPNGNVEQIPDHADDEDHVESVGAEDALEEVPERRQKPRLRNYKIQEVIKRRQVLLVQVVKEERGNKGAALTTYLSLAGRYSVLMPNTGRGGGISRKITNVADRKRLKEVAQELEVPEGMGIILRTAGASRTKAEIKRDFEYLLRLWENVRDLTLKSAAPTLVYEEGSLVKRSIRDLYNKDIDEVLVAGDDAYREAKDFMRMLMPSHARNVQPYRDSAPIFARFGVEPQLDAMFSPQVTLRSGGYIVINQTEALVSIDVNSGRSTREHNIEDTAFQTNMEAAEEVARQLRLRDLAGLIVIDFIDMEEARNNKGVERKLKDCLKDDRARIQVGRISHFGLLEMSRQRIRTGVLEGSTEVCPHCLGAGIVRSTDSVALHVLRSLEDQLLKGVTHHLTLRTRTAVALYILNQKRRHLGELEVRFGLSITISADEHLSSQHYVLERGEIIANPLPAPIQIQPDTILPVDEDDDIVEEEAEVETEAQAETETRSGGEERNGDGDGQGRKRRRRRRRRRSGENGSSAQATENGSSGDDDEDDDDDNDAENGDNVDNGESDGRETQVVSGEATDADADADGEDAPGGDEDQGEESGRPRGRRRGRRGGRRRNGSEAREGGDADEATGEPMFARDVPVFDVAEMEEPLLDPVPGGEPPLDTAELDADEESPTTSDDPQDVIEHAETGEIAAEAETVDTATEIAAPAEEVAAMPADEAATEVDEAASPDEATTEAATETTAPERKPFVLEPTPEPDDAPKRGGWWQRRSFF